jgi:ubiquinone/menaquinone biosynthesis C-methylase UbiE
MTTTTANWTPRENPALDYERYLVPAFFAAFAEELTRLAAPWPGERVLDVACGTGALTRQIAERVGPGGQVTGLDLSPGMLAVAREQLDGPHVTWQEGSALELPFAPDSFDLVTCQQGLQFFPDRAVALREMRRVLRPGGRVALAVWRSTEYNPVWRLVEDVLAEMVGPEAARLPPFALGDAETLRRLAREAGFADVAVRIDGYVARFPSPVEFVRRAALAAPSMLGPLAAVGADALDRLQAGVQERMAPYVDDAGLAVPLATHVLLAR